MRILKKIFILFLSFYILTNGVVFAFPWSKKRELFINPQEKLAYVNLNWWENFSDANLSYYIQEAIKNNHDARKATYAVEEYRQFVKYQFAQELPSFSVGGNYIGVHFPDGAMKDFNKNIFTVPFSASYEADIFLKNRDKTKAKDRAYKASEFQEKGVYIALAADVATVYFNISKFNELIKLQQEAVNIKNEVLRRDEQRFQRGVISAYKLNNSKRDLQNARVSLDEYIKSRDKSLNQLAVLIGDSAENSCSYKISSFNSIKFNAVVPAEISSDVVFSRPDILAAEQNLQKAKIDVRIARKEFLPRITINGLYSFTNLGGGSFFSWESTVAALAAGISQDIFKGGMKIANLKIYKARYEQVFEAYKQTDLIALKEIRDSLLIIDNDSKINDEVQNKLTYQYDNLNRVSKSYQRGVVSLPSLLNENELYLVSRQNKVNSQAALLVDYVTLYKAVGGKL